MSDEPGKHWESRYLAGRSEKLGWYRPRLDTSLELIRRLSPGREARLIDVGGGSSTLVDDLLPELEAVTVLDLSPAALAIARTRLGALGERVDWRVGNVLTIDLGPASFDVWHDRAVFHFLVEDTERRQYVKQLRTALGPGGHVVMGTFGLDAPPRCSGLPVQRYDIEQLADALGPGFRVVEARCEEHFTPGGTEQPYTYGLFEILRGT